MNRRIGESISTVLSEYGCKRTPVLDFLTMRSDFDDRRTLAQSIIEDIMMSHAKQDVLRWLSELARVELGIRGLKPRMRDHVVHALLTFLLGIYINEHLLKLSSEGVDPFQWKLAGLLHDVGYPGEIAADLSRPFTNCINEIKRSLNVDTPDIVFVHMPAGLDQLTGSVNALNLIQTRLDSWRLEIDAHSEYEAMLQSGRICHGILSGLAVLHVIDLLYQRHNPHRRYRDTYARGDINWNQTFFEEDIVSACSAIFIHNLPPRCFAEALIDRERTPVAFLLKLSDCLQDWGRPSKDNPVGEPDDRYDLVTKVQGLVYFAPADRRAEVEAEVRSSLVASDIEFR